MKNIRAASKFRRHSVLDRCFLRQLVKIPALGRYRGNITKDQVGSLSWWERADWQKYADVLLSPLYSHRGIKEVWTHSQKA